MAMEFHPATSIFPLMDDAQLSALAEDIVIHGQQEPITIHEGKILDGRNRWRACQRIDVMPQTRPWNGQGSPTAWIVSLNLQRLHLSESQRGGLGPAIERQFAAEVEAEHRERMSEAARKRHTAAAASTDTQQAELVPPVASPRTREQKAAREARSKAAATLGVNPHYISDAKRIEDKDPELLKEVIAGDKTIPEAKREIAQRERAEEQAITVQVLALAGDASGEVAASKLKAAWSRGVSQAMNGVLGLDLDAVIMTIDADDLEAAGQFGTRVQAFADGICTRYSRQMRGLRVVGGDD